MKIGTCDRCKAEGVPVNTSWGVKDGKPCDRQLCADCFDEDPTVISSRVGRHRHPHNPPPQASSDEDASGSQGNKQRAIEEDY